MHKTCRFQGVKEFLLKAMASEKIGSQADFFRRVNIHRKKHEYLKGHEFLRLVLAGWKLPDKTKATSIARALKVNPVDFFCVIENARLKDRGFGMLMVRPKKQKHSGEKACS